MNNDPPSPTRELSLADRIREMVEILGNQTKAADAANVSTRQLRMYLAGNSTPPFPAVAKLALAAGVNPMWVLTGEGEKLAVSPMADMPLPGNLQAVLELRRHLVGELSTLYEKNWGSDDLHEFVLSDALQAVVTKVPANYWLQGIKLVVEGHRGARLLSSRKPPR